MPSASFAQTRTFRYRVKSKFKKHQKKKKIRGFDLIIFQQLNK